MSTGKVSRSKEESAPKKEETCNDASDSEDEIFALMERAMRKKVVKHDLTGVTCYKCRERGHFGLHCPKGVKGVEVANRAPSVTPNILSLWDLLGLEEDDTPSEEVHKEEEVVDESEDEILASLDKFLERKYSKRDPKGYMCYICKKKGHLAENCPTREEEEVAAELAKPRTPITAWWDETSNGEEESAVVLNTRQLAGRTGSEREEKVSNKHSLIKVETFDLEKVITASMTLRDGKEIPEIEPDKGKIIGHSYGNNSRKPRISQISRVMSKEQGYYGAQHSGYIYYHPEYGIPVLVHCPML